MTPNHAAFHDLTAFQRDIMTVLAGHQQAPGVAILEEIEDYYERDIHPSRFYQAINRLNHQSLVAITKIDGRTNAYTLTDEGMQALTAGRQFKQTRAGTTASAVADGGTTGGEER